MPHLFTLQERTQVQGLWLSPLDLMQLPEAQVWLHYVYYITYLLSLLFLYLLSFLFFLMLA